MSGRDPNLGQDPETGVEKLAVDGQVFATGLRPSPQSALDALPPFGEANPIIPKDQWPTASPPWAAELEASLPVMNQGSVGACAAFATVGAYMRVRQAAGHGVQKFSPWSLYAQTNGGRDAGSTPTDNLEVIRTVGLGLDADNPSGVYYKSRLPRTALANAGRFKAEQAYGITPRDAAQVEAELMTALLLYGAVNFGMQLPRGFGNVGKDGVVPRGGYGGLHAMYLIYGYLDQKAGRAMFRVRNSWGSAWGDNGSAWLDIGHLLAGYFEANVIKAVLSDPQDSDNPPAPKVA